MNKRREEKKKEKTKEKRNDGYKESNRRIGDMR